MGKLLKIFRNKKNNQLFVALSRKKLEILKRKQDPDFLEVSNENLVYLKKKKIKEELI